MPAGFESEFQKTLYKACHREDFSPERFATLVDVVFLPPSKTVPETLCTVLSRTLLRLGSAVMQDIYVATCRFFLLHSFDTLYSALLHKSYRSLESYVRIMSEAAHRVIES